MKKLEAAHHKFQRTLPGTYEKIDNASSLCDVPSQ